MSHLNHHQSGTLFLSPQDIADIVHRQGMLATLRVKWRPTFARISLRWQSE